MPAYRILLPLVLGVLVHEASHAQTVSPASARVTAPPPADRATPAWTLKIKQEIRWQQVTPAGTLLLSTVIPRRSNRDFSARCMR